MIKTWPKEEIAFKSCMVPMGQCVSHISGLFLSHEHALHFMKFSLGPHPKGDTWLRYSEDWAGVSVDISCPNGFHRKIKRPISVSFEGKRGNCPFFLDRNNNNKRPQLRSLLICVTLSKYQFPQMLSVNCINMCISEKKNLERYITKSKW
jgi:hypothetical protein